MDPASSDATQPRAEPAASSFTGPGHSQKGVGQASTWGAGGLGALVADGCAEIAVVERSGWVW